MARCLMPPLNSCGYAPTLALASGSARLQEFDAIAQRRFPPHALMEHQGLHDLVSDGQYRVEGGHGLLEYHGNPVAPDITHHHLHLKTRDRCLERSLLPSRSFPVGWG